MDIIYSHQISKVKKCRTFIVVLHLGVTTNFSTNKGKHIYRSTVSF